MKRLALIALVVTFVTPALAQLEPQAQRRVVFDMEADIIEGVVLTSPHMPMVGTPPKPTHKNLIQVRKSFAAELLASASRI